MPVVERYQSKELEPGFGICLFDTEGPLWSYYYGYADTNRKIPFSGKTVFWTGNVSELAVAAKILQLSDAGKIHINDPISRYIPDFFKGAVPGSGFAKIADAQIEDILSHLTGIAADYSSLDYVNYEPLRNLKEFLVDAGEGFPPGSRYTHAGALFDLLGILIEKTEGKPFGDAMKEGIFHPLGMESTSFKYHSSLFDATLNYKSRDTNPFETKMLDFQNVEIPSNSMRSTIEDLIPFYSSLIDEEEDRPFLSHVSIRKMFTTKSEYSLARQGKKIGYVWMLSLPELSHLGEIAWYNGRYLSNRNVIILARDLGIGVVCATNSWEIIETESILDLAVETLNKYAETELGIAIKRIELPSVERVPPGIVDSLKGVFASPFGVYAFVFDEASAELALEDSSAHLEYRGRGGFYMKGDSDIEIISAGPEGYITIYKKNDTIDTAAKVRHSPYESMWVSRTGTYRIRDSSKLPAFNLYAFSLNMKQNALVVSSGDAKEYLVVPSSPYEAKVLCNASSIFFGKTLKVSDDSGLMIEGVAFEKTRGGS